MRLDRATCQQLVDAALDRAAELGIRVTVTVVDEQGHDLAVVRAGAAWFTVGVAHAKAATAALMQSEGSAWADVVTDHPEFRRLVDDQMVAPFTTLPGGSPLRAGRQVLGAVGVSGGSGDQDVDCVRAALAVWDGLAATDA